MDALRLQKEEMAHLNQFILHSALDVVEELKWSQTGTRLQTRDSKGNATYSVDSFNQFSVTSYVTPGRTPHTTQKLLRCGPTHRVVARLTEIRFMMLHDAKGEASDSKLDKFFKEVHELYVKILLSPFYEPSTAIKSPGFAVRVKALLTKHMGGAKR